MGAASAGLRRQLGAAADRRQRRRRRRRCRRSDAGDAAAGAPAVPAPGTRQPRRGARTHAPDAPVRQRRGQAAYRPGLLLGRAHARARAGRDDAGRALPLRRRADPHGRGRMLDLRHVAPAPRAQRRRAGAHPPGRRHGRRRRPVGPACARAAASGADRRLAGADRIRRRGGRTGARIRVAQPAEGNESVGTALAHRLPVHRVPAACRPAGAAAVGAALPAPLAGAVDSTRRSRRRAPALPGDSRRIRRRRAPPRPQHRPAQRGDAVRCDAGDGDEGGVVRWPLRAALEERRNTQRRLDAHGPRRGVRSSGLHRVLAAVGIHAAVRDAGACTQRLHDRRRKPRPDRNARRTAPGRARLRFEPARCRGRHG